MADTVVTFTLAQLYEVILGSCALMSAVWGVIALIIKAWNKAKAPENLQNERLNKIESRLARHDELFAQDNERLGSIEESNKLTQKALLALLKHGCDGNEIDAMKAAQKDIETYLINR